MFVKVQIRPDRGLVCRNYYLRDDGGQIATIEVVSVPSGAEYIQREAQPGLTRLVTFINSWRTPRGSGDDLGWAEIEEGGKIINCNRTFRRYAPGSLASELFGSVGASEYSHFTQWGGGEPARHNWISVLSDTLTKCQERESSGKMCDDYKDRAITPTEGFLARLKTGEEILREVV